MDGVLCTRHFRLESVIGCKIWTGGVRPALVVSEQEYSWKTHFCGRIAVVFKRALRAGRREGGLQVGVFVRLF